MPSVVFYLDDKSKTCIRSLRIVLSFSEIVTDTDPNHTAE